MIYKKFKDKTLSNLGFGLMRLPTNEDGSVDEFKTKEMVDFAIRNGVNYFDTAHPYMNGTSEIVIGKILKNYPRDGFYLADKYPGHQIMSEYKPQEIFEEQLKKCQVDYFDFYLLHSVNEGSISTYEDKRWNIINYFIEQKNKGRIKHLGFSSHGLPDNLEYFLSKYHQEMEFCQIQLNYLDWTLQNAKEKVDILNKYNIPIWVMEPVRGGKLASLDEDTTKCLKDMRKDESTAAWAFRFLQGINGVTVILSGMSNFEQVEDNIKTFKEYLPLNEEENKYILKVADSLKQGVPCTDCKYCMKGCPQNLEIPRLLAQYNDFKIRVSLNPVQYLEALPEDKHPSNCIGCGACSRICPQHIDIPKTLKELCELQKAAPSWRELSLKREEAAKKHSNNKQ